MPEEIKVISEKQAAIDALYIAHGASNPVGVARSVHQMCLSALRNWEDGGSHPRGHNGVADHPAIKLAVYQLSFLMGMEPISEATVAKYSEWEKACIALAGNDLPESLRPEGWEPPEPEVDEAAEFAEQAHNLVNL